MYLYKVKRLVNFSLQNHQVQEGKVVGCILVIKNVFILPIFTHINKNALDEVHQKDI